MKLHQKDDYLCSRRSQTDQNVHCIALEQSLMAHFDWELSHGGNLVLLPLDLHTIAIAGFCIQRTSSEIWTVWSLSHLESRLQEVEEHLLLYLLLPVVLQAPFLILKSSLYNRPGVSKFLPICAKETKLSVRMYIFSRQGSCESGCQMLQLFNNNSHYHLRYTLYFQSALCQQQKEQRRKLLIQHDRQYETRNTCAQILCGTAMS